MAEKVADNKRVIIQAVIGFLLGRVWIFSMNPFAVAYFAVTLAERKGRGVVFASVLVGMAGVMSGTTYVKYILLFSLLLFADTLLRKRNEKNSSLLLVALASTLLNFILGATNAFLAFQTKELMLMCLLESIAIFALINVFQWGTRYLLYEEFNKVLRNEELVSLIMLVTLSLYGMPRYFDGLFSVATTIMYLVVLYTGYRYGSSAGAIAGAAGGILAAMTGAGTVAIGLYCLLGVGIGMFRQAGRVLSSIAFFFMGMVLAYVFKQEIVGVVELRGIVSAVILFLALPKSIIQMIETDFTTEEENPFAKDDVKTIANYKMEDFSGAFQRLGKAFARFGEQESTLSENEMTDIFNELSEKICSDCTNCNFCWDKHYNDTFQNVNGILQMASEQGIVTESDVGEAFERRCIRLPEYIERANESISLAKVNLGWRNKLAESRDAVARQMIEVAGMLKDFTVELEDVTEIDREEKRQVFCTLKSLGLQIKKLSLIKKRNNRIQVQFFAKRRGKNCITKKDVCLALYNTLGIRFRAVGETKNVISDEFETVTFAEDVNFKVLTGMSRVAKSGEQVSGDNFSFLELGTGELLMVLSDGMGSGMMANEDSECLVEVLENLMEAGFQKESAIRLLNSLFVLSYAGRTFTTLDIASINLYTGTLEVMKNGAAATFIKRKSRVETIYSGALPVGIDLEADTTEQSLELKDGDIIVMVTDGIIDAFPGEAKEFYIENILMNISSNNPNEIANTILMQALERNAHLASDDMSVLVTGIWEKTGKY